VRGYKPAEIGNSLPKRVPQRKIELTQGFKAEGIVANFNILLNLTHKALNSLLLTAIYLFVHRKPRGGRSVEVYPSAIR
jgi:hypothetical protein